ncbi:MAG: hypothetical protein EHM93_19605 [Bacteroidales bacterium]|nr:MAG: hypothetical protein EHM93_19605 [Bacteroidales bacterium]
MEKKIYTERVIWTGTFLGGPLVTGYLMAENFKVLNEPEKVKRTWIFSIIATIIIFGGLFIIPNIEKVPNYLIPLLYTSLAYFLAQYYQGEKIKAFISNGGLTYKWSRALVIGLIGAIIIILPIIVFTFLTTTVSSLAVTSKTYGTMKHEIAYDKTNISEIEIDNVASGFIQTGFFDLAETKYTFVKKKNNIYEVSISCNNTVSETPEALEPFIQLKKDMQKLFPSKKIVFNLVVDNLDNIVKKIE